MKQQFDQIHDQFILAHQRNLIRNVTFVTYATWRQLRVYLYPSTPESKINALLTHLTKNHPHLKIRTFTEHTTQPSSGILITEDSR